MFSTSDAGDVDKEEGSVAGYAYQSYDILTQTSALLKGITGDLGTATANFVKGLAGKFGLDAIFSAVADLDKKSADLVKILGVGGQRGAELQTTIADAIPQFLEMGLKADDASSTYEKLIKKFGTNLKLSDEQLASLAATAKVTGIEVDVLAENFRNVGYNLESVEKRMMEVTKIANQAGVTVAAVAGGVSTNLGKMNLFNFENGTKGLAKMAVQASRLGIDMKSVFAVVEDVFDPEKAIDLAASLQMLGVRTGELLDPLRLMDLAQNDPTELQNQIVNMSKEFVRFNEQNQKFEIMPGAKRRLREVAGALQMGAEEFASMSIKAAEFDTKMKQIKFSPDINEEDKELVATLSQINEKGIAQIKVRKFDEQGKPLEEQLINASDITAEQIKDLKKQQELEGQSMQKIAIDQLSEAAKTNAILDRGFAAYSYGLAGTKIPQGIYQGYLGGVQSLGGLLPEKSETYRTNTDETIKKLQEMLKGYGIDVGDIGTTLESTYNTAIAAIKSVFKTDPTVSSNMKALGSSASYSSSDLTLLNELEKLQATETKQFVGKLDVGDATINVNVKVPDLLTQDQKNQWMTYAKEYFSNAENVNNIMKSYVNLVEKNAGLTSSK